MKDSQLPQEFEEFRRDAYAENAQRLKKQLVNERSWILRIVPRFSLLTLLLLVMLFALGAAYISLKRSTDSLVKQKDEEIRFLHALGDADRGLLGHQMNLIGMPAVGTVAVVHRLTWQPIEFPVLFMQLDPAKNYVIHARQSDVTNLNFSEPEKSIVIRAIGPRDRNRNVVVLRLAGSPELVKDPDNIFHGSFDCVVEYSRLDSNRYVGYQYQTERFIRTKPVQVQKTKELKEFHQLWQTRQALQQKKPTLLFQAIDRASPPDAPSGLIIWIEEINLEDIPLLPNRVLFPSNDAN